MSELVVEPYSRTEAKEAVDRFVSTGWSLRHMILDMFDRKAHTALGYSEFSEFTSAELGGQWDHSALSRLRAWARVEQALSSSEELRLPQREAAQFNRLPEELWAETYKELKSIPGAGDNQLNNLTHIVNRRLGPKVTILPPVPTKSAEVEPEVPVGAVVDVHSGKPIEEPYDPYKPDEDSDDEERAFLAELKEAHEDVRQQCKADDERVFGNAVSCDPMDPKTFPVFPEATLAEEGTDLNCIGKDERTKLSQFRTYWKLGSDVETLDQIINQLYTIKKGRLAKYE